MKIIFFGSGKFAVVALEALCKNNFSVSLVITQPDRKKGRHMHLGATPVKEYAIKSNLKIFQPENINLENNIEIIKREEADIFIVVSYGKILSKEVLNIPKIMAVNIHASLLPKYRGSSPINRVLINGDKKTGIAFIKMNEYMDKGDIILQKELEIEENDCVLSLENKLARLASDCIGEVLDKITNAKFKLKKQDDSLASYAALMKKQDGEIKWEASARDIYNQFRGCFGWPGSFTNFKGKILKILDMEPSKRAHTKQPGEIMKVEGGILEIACSDGSILIKEVQPEGKNKMPVVSFLAGHRINIGDILT